MILDDTIALIYLPSRMKVGVAIGRLGAGSHAITRLLLLGLPLFLLAQLIGQPDLDDRRPVVGSRALSAKVFKQDHVSKGGLMPLVSLALAAGIRQFAPEFYLTFVRLLRQQDFVRAPLVSLRSSRSPPHNFAV